MTGALPAIRACGAGAVGYTDALEWQRTLLEARKAAQVPDTMLLLEHPHVYTLGRRATTDDVLASPAALRALGAEVVETDRGGEVTYHGPGQLVGYPVISIRDAGIGPVSYVRILEQAIIDALRQWGVAGHRVMGKTGVWAGGEPGEKPGKGQNPRGRKIAAIGVRVSGGVAMHGFALNVSTDLSYYQHIVPCGMPRLDMTSIRGETADASDAGAVPTVRHAGEVVAGILARHLQRELVWTSPAAVRPAATASA